MDTRHMRYFVALGDTLHFGRAAERMHMTQPPFSRQIANLERDLGVQLVERTSRNVVLTEAGARFLRDSRDVVARFDRACRDARLVADGRKGELRLGFMMHAAHRIVPALVDAYLRERPEVRVILVESTPGDIGRRLLHGELDAAVTFGGHGVPHVVRTHILTDRLWLIAAPDHPLARCEAIEPADLAGVDLIASEPEVARPLHEAIAGFCARGGIEPLVRFAPQLQQTILRLVAAGLGVALVPGSMRDERFSDVVWRPLVSAPALEVVLDIPADGRNPAVPPLLDLVMRRGFDARP